MIHNHQLTQLIQRQILDQIFQLLDFYHHCLLHHEHHPLCHHLHHHPHHHHLHPPCHQVLDQIFQQLDEENNGYVTAQHLMAIIR